MSRRADWPAGRSAAGCVDCVALSAVRAGRVRAFTADLVLGRSIGVRHPWVGGCGEHHLSLQPVPFCTGVAGLAAVLCVCCFICVYIRSLRFVFCFVSWPLFWFIAMLLFSSREGSCPFLATMAAHKLQYA